MLTIVSVFFNFKNADKFEQAKKSIVDQSMIYAKKNKYLERCLNYNSLLFKDSIPIIRGKKIAIYFSGGACFSCLESLMKLLKEEYNLQDQSYVIVDDLKKQESVISFNDAYNANYNYECISNNLLGNYQLNDILVINFAENQIKVLEYKPEEEYIFKEYFDFFINLNKKSS